MPKRDRKGEKFQDFAIAAVLAAGGTGGTNVIWQLGQGAVESSRLPPYVERVTRERASACLLTRPTAGALYYGYRTNRAATG